MTKLLEKNSYTNWLTVLHRRGRWGLEDGKGKPYYEFHFKIDGRAAIFYCLTKVDSDGSVRDNNPTWIPDEVVEVVIEHHPELQPIMTWDEFEAPTCLVCDSQEMWHDKREEYFCPFCNNES